MTKSELIALAERVEALDGPSREIMGEAYRAIFPPVRSKDHSRKECEAADLRAHRYFRMLDADAYESAAMMLVPEGYFWAITMRGEKRGGFHACCALEGGLEWIEAKAAALALTAAALRAMAESAERG